MASLDFEFAGSNQWELQETFKAMHRTNQKHGEQHHQPQSQHYEQQDRYSSYSSIPYIQPEGTGWQGYRDEYNNPTGPYLPPMRTQREPEHSRGWGNDSVGYQDYPHDESIFPQHHSMQYQSQFELPPIHPPSLVEANPMRGVPAPEASHYRPDGRNEQFQQYLPPAREAASQKPRLVQRDLGSFITPYLEEFIQTPNRLAFGERSIIILSSKVAQKSYGLEKRFLCPPPTAILLGNSWYSDIVTPDGDNMKVPPRVSISISGEKPVQDCPIEWTSAVGKSFEGRDPPTGTTYIGRSIGKQLYITVDDDKNKKVEALVKVTSQTGHEDRVIGVFPSRPIKVISKPSKKRQSNKAVELSINHGSVVSLFHRLRSQTVSTKYLCVSGASSAYTGSDGSRMVGANPPNVAPSFVARTATWDPFVIYIVDVNKPQGTVDPLPPPPPQGHPEYPSPPPNAVEFVGNGIQTPVMYNQTVVLQCLTSGVVSPILIIRKVDHSTIAVGGGRQDGLNTSDLYCVQGDVCGDSVSQLHKIGFEVYDHKHKKGEPAHGQPGDSGMFLSCMGDKVNTFEPTEGRQWNPFSEPILKARSASPPPSTPLVSGSRRGPLSRSASPTPDVSFDGGRVNKPRRSTASTGFTSKAPPRGRRRAGSAAGPGVNEVVSSNGALWQVDIGETSVWTIVGTDQVRYNFYVPPVLFNGQTPSRGSPTPHQPVTPIPQVLKYLAPGVASETTRHNTTSARLAAMQANPRDAKLITIYGENFDKNNPPQVYFGTEPSSFVEVRCKEVLACMPPPESADSTPRTIMLVRSDGVTYSSGVKYP